MKKGILPISALILTLLIITLLFSTFTFAAYDGTCDNSTELDQLPPGHWCRAGKNTMNSVKPNPMPINTAGQSYSNNEGVLTYSGGAYDTLRNMLLVWGGGIGGTYSPGYYDYSGNEIYAFNITNFTWSRIWGPTPNSQIISLSGGNGTYLDGNPGSRNTYDMIEYLPNQDQMWIQGGSVFASGDLAQDTWVFSPATKTWTKKANPLNYSTVDSGSAYDPVTGHIFAIRNDQGGFGYYGLYDYNPSSNVYTLVNPNVSKSSGQVVAIDPVRRRILVLGSGSISAYDLITGNQLPFSTTGDTAPLFTQNPGFEYDPSTDLMIVWGGNYVSSKYVLDIYSLNLTSLVWRIHNLSSTSTMIPTTPKFGTFGRFRYIPSKNVFVVVNGAAQLTYFYRFSQVQGTKPEITLPSVSITWPIIGQQVVGTIQIYAEASDNVGVANVTFLVDSQVIGKLTSPDHNIYGNLYAYNITWNTLLVSNGQHTLSAEVRDLSNNYVTSNIVSVNVNNQPPTAPTSLSATAVSPYQINLAWTASTDNTGVAGYKIFRNDIFVTTTQGTLFSDQNLTPSTLYTYKVGAYDKDGLDSANATAQATTQPPDTVPPTAPTSLSATAVSPYQVNLSWTPSTDNIAILGYKIFRNDIFVTTTQGNSFGDQNLTPSTFYLYKISAYDQAGLYSPNATASATTQPPDTVPPTAPTSLSATAVSPYQITLEWVSSIDNVEVKGYKIYRDDVLITTTKSTRYPDISLTPFTTYSYKVSAYDQAGFHSPNATTQATTWAYSYDGVCNTLTELESLPAESWCITSTNTPNDVRPNPMPLNGWGNPFSDNYGAIYWGGGAFDTKRDRLLVWGGGDDHYSGNEIYSFDINNMIWSRIWGPTPNSQIISPRGGNGTYLDGNPASRVIFDNIEYIPGLDIMWIIDGYVFNGTGNVDDSFAQDIWYFNIANLSWEKRLGSFPIFVYTGVPSAYDPVTKHMFYYLASNGIYEYDPIKNSLSEKAKFGFSSGQKAAAIDPVRRKMFIMGQCGLHSYDLNTGIFTENVPTNDNTGYTVSPNCMIDPSLEYDPTTDQLVSYGSAYCNISGCIWPDRFFSLNLDTMVWTKHDLSPLNLVPPPRSRYTTRFRYIPSKNVFIAVYNNTHQVYFYKMSSSAGIPHDTQPPTAPTSLSATAVSPYQINLAWTASTDNTGVAGYKIYRDNSYLAITTSTTYLDTGLTPSTLYTYKVSAYDAESLYSPNATASATTPFIDTAPPVRSNLYPQGQSFPSTTTQVTISLNTDESATCKYSASPNIVYGQMINTFSTTGGASHSTIVPTGSPGTYNYYIKCSDSSGNNNTNDAQIYFSITLSDTTPPTINSVSSSGNPNQVTVIFSEPVEQTSASTISNYLINNAITISSASLASDQRTATLSTSAHQESINYTITVNNIQDLSSPPNTIAPNTQKTYSFTPALIISNLVVSSARAYRVVYNGLVVGALTYIDRAFTFTSIPSSLIAKTYIQTANDDKASTANPFLSFDVNQDVTVYIAHDNRITTKPSWLSSFTDTLKDISNTDTTFSLFERNFTPGTITLGGNEGGGNSMYSVIIVPTLTSTQPPVLSITSPTPGQSIQGSQVNVVYTKSGNLSQVDHVHIQLDSNPEIRDLDFDGFYNFTGVSAGSHIIQAYMAYANHTEVSGTRTSVSFTTTLPDTTPPTITLNSPSPATPATYTTTQTYTFSAQITDNTALQIVYLENNFNTQTINITLTSATSTFSYSRGALSVGTYTYKFIAIDSSGNQAVSAPQTYIVSQANPSTTVSLSPPSGATYTTPTTASCSSTNTQVTTTLYRNSIAIPPETSTLGVGTYNFTCITPSNQNYTRAASQQFYTIVQAQSQINLTLSTLRQDTQIFQGQSVPITALLNAPSAGQVIIYQNGAAIASGPTPQSITPTYNTIGNYNITGYFAGNQNYTQGYETHFVVVGNPPDTAPPSVLILSPSDNTITNNQQVSITCSASDLVQLRNISLVLDNIITDTIQTSQQSISNIFTRTLTEGAHTFTCEAYDNSSNKGQAPQTRTITIDTTPPELAITSPTATTYNTPQVLLSYSASGYLDLYYNLNGGPSTNLTQPIVLTLSDNIYTLVLTARDLAGNQNVQQVTFRVDTSVASCIKNCEINISLIQGINLISLPLIPQNYSIEYLFQAIKSNINAIYTYDPVSFWKVYHKDPVIPSTLTVLQPRRAFFVITTQPTTLAMRGDLLDQTNTTPPLVLGLGWNLIGTHNLTDQLVDDTLSGYNYSSVWEFQSGTQSYRILNTTTDRLSYARGYWAYLQ